MKVTRRDLWTPANALTLTGLVMSSVGAWRLTTLVGVVLFGLGRLLDIADGAVARRTHSSDFGALFDATADKCVMLFTVIAAWHYHVVPLGILVFVTLQNIANTVDYFYATRIDHGPTPVKTGKYSAFSQVALMGCFALSQFGLHQLWATLGWTIFISHLPLALWATSRYTKQALDSRH